jgi:3-keto-disaccharide hydrolase
MQKLTGIQSMPIRIVLIVFSISLFVLTACNSPSPSTTQRSSESAVESPRSSGSNTSNEVADEIAIPVLEAPRPLADNELQQGWISLFDGETMFGWTHSNDANWRVEDGAIVVDHGDVGLLCTTTEFSDYVLHVEFRSAAGTNSGIFLHTPLEPKDPSTDCYELNIADSDNPFPTCSLVKRQKTAGNFNSADWQAYDITVSDDQIIVNLDGTQVLEYTDPKPLHRGHIGLQLNQGRIEFRNIKLKPLNTTSLFNGKDLTGWKTYPEMASKFTVTEEGWMNVKDGRGQLETEASYGDFVLQLECMTHADQLNSGFFFRCIPGSTMNGYESQIHNGFQEGDRRKPVDCGTGGIFRRVDARLVVANDQEWFYKTIIADGDHIATWVNGYQVVDWMDERDADENPRKGLRLEAGTIMIQGHDPTTGISFRNLRVAEVRKRN